ncbi:MAG: type II secretion system F family protein [Aeromicrobium sp.]
MLLIGSTFFILAILVLLYALGLVGVSSRSVKARLREGLDDPRGKKGSKEPRPSLQTLGEEGVGRFVLPKILVAKANRNLVLAGHPSGWTLRSIMTAKFVLVGMAVLVMFAIVSANSSSRMILAGFVFIVVGYALPDALLQGRAVERQKQIEMDLPDILDQATIAIESGLSFEASLARVGHSSKGPLAEEIVRTVQDMRLGMSRRDAYSALSERTSVADLKRFSKSIVQAEEFGVPVATVVRNLAKEMRMKRRYRAEAKALQIPVKMLFPLLVCVFPVLFVVVLFPAFANLGATLAAN